MRRPMRADLGRARLTAPTPPLLRFIFSPRQLAATIGHTFRKFAYIVYVLPASLKYRKFTIAKRRTGVREINAPRWPLLRIQKLLKPLLDEIYWPRGTVHGFVEGRSIVTNARVHVRARWVLNLDLQ